MTEQNFFKAKENIAQREILIREYNTLASATNFTSTTISLQSPAGDNVRTMWLHFPEFKARALQEIQAEIKKLEDEFNSL